MTVSGATLRRASLAVVPWRTTMIRREPWLQLAVLGCSVLIGIWLLIVPLFGEYTTASAFDDFINHVALVAAAADTLRETYAVSISTDQIHPGIEYPYFLFGNPAFYWSSALAAVLLGAPAYVGAG